MGEESIAQSIIFSVSLIGFPNTAKVPHPYWVPVDEQNSEGSCCLSQPASPVQIEWTTS
jgi:hypothetical protein